METETETHRQKGCDFNMDTVQKAIDDIIEPSLTFRHIFISSLANMFSPMSGPNFPIPDLRRCPERRIRF